MSWLRRGHRPGWRVMGVGEEAEREATSGENGDDPQPGEGRLGPSRGPPPLRVLSPLPLDLQAQA